MKKPTLLLIDGGINLILGVLLIAFPQSLVAALGVPLAESAFYPNILGGVLFGIGIALLIEWKGQPGVGLGLGLWGAVAINLCGGFVLTAWLIFGELALPAVGVVFLWILAVLLIGLSFIEIMHSFKRGN